MLKRKKIGVRLADASRGTEEGGWGEWEEGRRAEGGVAREEGGERKSTKGSRKERRMDCRRTREREMWRDGEVLEGCGEERERERERGQERRTDG